MDKLLAERCGPDPEKIREKQREGGKKAGKGRPGDRSPVKDGRPKSVGRRDSETSAKAASGVGLGQSTYERAKKVISAAESNPAMRPIVDEMPTAYARF